MAEGFARRYGAGVVNVASAGLSSAHSIARETVEVMREREIDLGDQFPKDFEPCLAESYDLVVNISGFRLPTLKRPAIAEWSVQDPYGHDIEIHRAVRDDIEQRVNGLISDIKHHGKLVSSSGVGQRIAPDEVRRPRLWQRLTKWR